MSALHTIVQLGCSDHRSGHIGGFPKMGLPQNHMAFNTRLVYLDDLGYPLVN